LLVADIMTLKPKLEVLLMDEVQKARVGDIIATLRQVNRQHAMVVDADPDRQSGGARHFLAVANRLQLGLDIDPALPPDDLCRTGAGGNQLRRSPQSGYRVWLIRSA
jgi:hypothetical protein